MMNTRTASLYNNNVSCRLLIRQSCRSICSALFLLFTIVSCSSTTVKTANYEAVKRETSATPEYQLLDVGIQIFNNGLDRALEDEDLLIFPEVRNAESRFIPFRLMEAIQTSAAWGAVRVVPQDNSPTDVLVKGEIIQSDGELLIILVDVSDSTGRHWFERTYQGVASKYAYQRRNANQGDPFQGVYNRIANDMLENQRSLEEQDFVKIRQVSELRFAQNFAPDAFAGHLQQNKDGHYDIVRLPASNDPMLARINQIRERDYLFVDTLQDYYGNFVHDMNQPYQEWRSQTYSEVISMRKLQRTSRNRTIAGILSIVGGIAAVGSNNSSVATAGLVGVTAGGYLVKSGFDTNAQSKIHIEALQELGDSLEAEIEPRVIELEDRTVTLSGTVENQYDQWRELLKDIYQLDTQGKVN